MQTPVSMTAKYGDPRINTAGWAAKWLTVYRLPDWLLPHFPPLYDGSKVTRIQMHKDAVAPFEAAMRELVDTGLIQELHSFDGCWNVRNMRGLSTPSIHSWGCAFDLNASRNPLGVAWGSRPGMFSAAFVAVMRKHFDCGADWHAPRTDAMHFQTKQ